MRVPARLTLAIALLAGVAGGCGGDGGGTSDAAAGETVALRLGFFANVTHAPALVGVEGGRFDRALGDRVDLRLSTFNAGPEAVEALFSDALDATFIGPSPAINAYAQSGGEAIRIVAGTASGGASLVVQPEIDSAEDLAGTKLASPQLGNTQDVALRAWLADHGYETDTTGGGDVSVVPQENSQTLETFRAGTIDGAWVPEPWATRLVEEGGGKVLVDERDLWPGGRYVTTHLIVRTEYLDEHPDVVQRLIEGLADSIDLIADDPVTARDLVSRSIERISGSPIGPELVDAAFRHIEFTLDPIASSLRKSADDAEALGLLEPVDLDGIYDLALVNAVLRARGEDEVKES